MVASAFQYGHVTPRGVGMNFLGLEHVQEVVLLMDHRRPGPASPSSHTPHSFAGESIVTYLTAVLTDLLHTQRDPLALCLLLQAYDKLELPVLPCCHQLSRFNRYYSLWIPEPAREALVSWGCGRDPCSCRSQAFP